MTITDTAFMLFFSPENVSDGGITPDIIERAATRHVWSWLKTAHYTLADRVDFHGPNDYSYVVGIAAAIKAITPAAKVGLYVGGLGQYDVLYPGYDWLADADQLHHPNGTPIVVTPALSPAEPGARRIRMPNLASATTRQKLIANWALFAQSHGFDGLAFDTWQAEYYGAQFLAWAPLGAREGSVHSSLWWAQQLRAFTSEMTAAFEPLGLEVWSNGLEEPGSAYDPSNPTDAITGPASVNLVLYNDGILAEYAHRIWLGGAHFTDFLAQADQARALSGRIFYDFIPYTFRFSDPAYFFGPSYDGNDDGNDTINPAYTAGIADGSFARFYLASFLLIHRPGATYFGFHDGISYQGYTAPPHEPYLYDGGADWDQEIGAPIGTYAADATGGATVYYREYERAYVVVNPDGASSGSFGQRGLYRAWHPTTGDAYIVSPDAPRVAIPPRTGLVLFKVAQVITWRLPMRARLSHVVQETDGDVIANRAVTVYDADGVSAFGQTMYDAPTGGSVVTSPRTDSLGRLILYAPLGERVRLSIAGVAGQQDSEFVPDPEDILVEGTAIAIDQYAGVGDYALKVQPTTGGSGGNKALSVKAADGTNALKVAPHGVGSATEVGVTLPVLVIDNDNGAPRIYADLSDGSFLNRLLIQTSVTNGASDLGVMPNGSSGAASLTVWTRSNPSTSEGLRLRVDVSTATAALESFGVGLTGHDITIRPNQATALTLGANGDIRMPDAGLATNASAGYFFLCAMNGTPTGIPAQGTNITPLVYDRSANKLWSNNGGTWRSVTFS